MGILGEFPYPVIENCLFFIARRVTSCLAE